MWVTSGYCKKPQGKRNILPNIGSLRLTFGSRRVYTCVVPSFPGPPDPSRQCVHIKADGVRCASWAAKGGSYCPAHGSSATVVRHAAKMRLLACVEPALAGLLRVLEEAPKSDDWSAVCKAAQIILDRVGFGPQSKLVVEDERESRSDELRGMTREQLKARIAQIMSQLDRPELSLPSDDVLTTQQSRLTH